MLFRTTSSGIIKKAMDHQKKKKLKQKNILLMIHLADIDKFSTESCELDNGAT